jgi:hypothetical protein
MKKAAALLCAVALSGCTYPVQRIGEDRFLAMRLTWEPGSTTVADVVGALGPPDVIRWSGHELLYVYRAKRRVGASFVLTFYLKLFSYEPARQEDGTLLAAFDDRDVLLYYGASQEPRSDLAGDLGLRRLAVDLGLIRQADPAPARTHAK